MENERLEQELATARARVQELETALESTDANRVLVDRLRLSKTILDALDDTVFVFDLETGKALLWNRAFRDTSGFTDEEIGARKAPASWYGAEDLAVAAKAIERILLGEPNTIEMSLIPREGAPIPTEYNAASITGADGSRLMVAVGRDLRDRKRAEAALVESERRYRSLYLNTPVMLHSIDPEGRLISVSNFWLATLGYERDEVIGHSSTEFLTEASSQYAKEKILPEFFRTGQCKDVPYQFVCKNGDLIDVRLSAICETDKDGAVVRSVAVLLDVTERLRAEAQRDRLEEQLRQAQKMEAVGQLAGGIAHDFNNLLTGIVGNVDLAQLDLGEFHPVRGQLDEIDQAADRAAQLTRQLLAFSRRQLIRPRVLDLNQLLIGIETLLQRVIGEDVELLFRHGEALGRVKADPGQLEQVLMNLVVNARDAMPNGGPITVETSNALLDEAYCDKRPELSPGAYVHLAVSDKGEGMDMETLKRIFEPFFTTKESGTGTGLGLAMVYGIVKQHQGHVEAVSEVGKGTTVRVFLPLSPDRAEPVGRGPAQGTAPSGTETLLWVEDETGVREVGLKYLRRLGYTVLSAADGHEALAVARKFDGVIALLVTDVVMPGMNGRELAEHLMLERPSVRALFTSGYSEEVIAKHGVLDQELEFIAKPYSLRDLSLTVRRILDTPA